MFQVPVSLIEGWVLEGLELGGEWLGLNWLLVYLGYLLGATFHTAGYLGLEVPADGTFGISSESFALGSFPFEYLVQVLRYVLWILLRFGLIL